LYATEALYKSLSNVSPQLGDYFDFLVDQTIRETEMYLDISWHRGHFEKKGAALLDEKLVNESLRWLADPKYQSVLVPFQKGLSHLLGGTKDQQRYGDAVTDMYEALEAMAKLVTGKPTRELSALREEFIAKLRLPETHKVMLKEYIDYGCDFRHALEAGQPRTWPLEHEAENFVYMTGVFIRLAIQAEK
jgi:hypothetical protein